MATDNAPKRSPAKRFGAFRRRAYRRLRFRTEGKYFVGIAVGIGIAAINTGNNLLYLLLGWMLSAIIASGILSEQTLRRLRVRRHPPPQIVAGRPFLMGVTLTNDKQRVSSYSIEVEDMVDGRPLDKRCFFLKVPPGRTLDTSYRHTFARRGRVHMGTVRLSTKFPFAMFLKTKQVDTETEVVVLPATHPVRLPPPAPARGGHEVQARVGRSGEFFGLREYRDGDDRRDIHWRSSARHNRLLLREYDEESHRRATLVLDNSLPEEATQADEASLERAVSLTASLAKAYLAQSYAVGISARGLSLPPEAGPAQLGRVLRALALLPTVKSNEPFSPVKDRASEVTLVTRKGSVPTDRPAAVRVLQAD